MAAGLQTDLVSARHGLSERLTLNPSCVITVLLLEAALITAALHPTLTKSSLPSTP